MVGRLQVIGDLQALGMKDQDAKELLRIIDRQGMTNEALLAELEDMPVNETFATGVRQLKTVIEHISDFGVPKEYVQIDLRIARNFGYYTGTVYETLLRKQKGLRSFCSGGHYDDLTAQFTQKRMPGVGASTYLGHRLLRLNESRQKRKPQPRC